jgi:hypothetical protein
MVLAIEVMTLKELSCPCRAADDFLSSPILLALMSSGRWRSVSS